MKDTPTLTDLCARAQTITGGPAQAELQKRLTPEIMALPPDIEAAIFALINAMAAYGRSATEQTLGDADKAETNLRTAIAQNLESKAPIYAVGDAPTQRQRYKEAALTVIEKLYPEKSWLQMAKHAGDYSDALLAEDAEHARKSQ